MTTVLFRQAEPQEADMLSELALAAKDYWGYDQAFLDACREELTFTATDLARRRFVVAEVAGAVAGFYNIDGSPPAGELGNLWLAPARIGTGLGRALWQHAMAAAADAGFERLEIGAEPYAEGFYLRMGAERIGEVASESIPGRVLPLLQVTIPTPHRRSRASTN